jgi:probable rRNA maturation factor
MSSRPAGGGAPLIDVLVESPLWKDVSGAKAAVRTAIGAAAHEISSPAGEVAVVLTDDAALRKLNREWRNIDKPTNVLSFPASATGPAASMLGDIVIAYETLARESRDEGKEFVHHLSHIAVHGFLHLMGYDHQSDSDAAAMEKLESAVLARLRISDPYLVRDLGR